MNWDISNLKTTDRNFISPPLTIKSIRKFTPEEVEHTDPSWSNYLWPYWVEFAEDITFSNGHISKGLPIFKTTFTDFDTDGETIRWNSNVDKDVFYYFTYYLNLKRNIPFRSSLNNKQGNSFFLLSDTKNIDSIITGEKKKWDDLGYINKEDLVQENKQFIEQKISKAQKYLNQHYPKDQRKNIKELDLSNLDLAGNLDLTEFVNLERLNVDGNPWLDDDIVRFNSSLESPEEIFVRRDGKDLLVVNKLKKAHILVETYNSLKYKRDKDSLKKLIEYAEEMKKYHSEGIELNLENSEKEFGQAIDDQITIIKKEIEKLEKVNKEVSKDIGKAGVTIGKNAHGVIINNCIVEGFDVGIEIEDHATEALVNGTTIIAVQEAIVIGENSKKIIIQETKMSKMNFPNSSEKKEEKNNQWTEKSKEETTVILSSFSNQGPIEQNDLQVDKFVNIYENYWKNKVEYNNLYHHQRLTCSLQPQLGEAISLNSINFLPFFLLLCSCKKTKRIFNFNKNTFHLKNQIKQPEQKKEQFQGEVFANNYLQSRLSKVEEIVQEQRIIQQQPFGFPSSSK